MTGQTLAGVSLPRSAHWRILSTTGFADDRETEQTGSGMSGSEYSRERKRVEKDRERQQDVPVKSGLLGAGSRKEGDIGVRR